MKRAFLLFVSVIILTSCTNRTLMRGSINDGCYIDRAYQFSVILPDGWSVKKSKLSKHKPEKDDMHLFLVRWSGFGVGDEDLRAIAIQANRFGEGVELSASKADVVAYVSGMDGNLVNYSPGKRMGPVHRLYIAEFLADGFQRAESVVVYPCTMGTCRLKFSLVSYPDIYHDDYLAFIGLLNSLTIED